MQSIEYSDDYITLSKACAIKHYSVKKVLTFLAEHKVIPKESQRKNALFHYNKYLNIISTGSNLKVIKTELFDYLDREATIEELTYTDQNIEILDKIVDLKIRFERINKIRNKRLCFIDAEFKNGNYHELAWEIWENGVCIEKRYVLERAHFLKKLKSPFEDERFKRLKDHNQSVEILTRKTINKILKNDLSTTDYIVAHNAGGERNMLINNGMWIDKTKFLCTSKMSTNFVAREQPALIDLVNHYHLPYDSHFVHYAHEDTAMTSKVFFAMLDDAKERFND